MRFRRKASFGNINEILQLAFHVIVIFLFVFNTQVNCGNIFVSTTSKCTADDEDCCFTGQKTDIINWCDEQQGEERCCIDGACDELFDYPYLTEYYYTICKGSCWGSNACDIGVWSTVHPDSCRGQNACQIDSATTVDSDSCNGDFACWGMGLTCVADIDIQSGSCNGEQACAYLGEGEARSIEIQKKSCNGEEACAYIGHNNAESVVIRGSACDGEQACTDIGYYAASVAISTGTCDDADDACFECASTVDYTGVDLLVDEDFCNDN